MKIEPVPVERESVKEDSSRTLQGGRGKILFSWKAPIRPFKRRGKEFLTTVLTVAFLLSVIFYFIEGILPVIVIIALVFLVWVFSTFAPEETEHSITKKGVVFAGKFYPWRSLTRFWFAERFGSTLLILESLELPGRIELVIDGGSKKATQDILEKYLPFEEAPPGFLDKTASWLGKRLPLGE